MATVPIFAPDGTLGDIPAEHLAAAVKAGAKPGVHITAPDGSPGVIPADRTADAVKAGAKIVPITDQPIKTAGFWHSLASDLAGMASGAYKTLTGPDPLADPNVSDADKNKIVAQQQADAAAKIQARRQNQPYPGYADVAAPAAEMLGANVSGMEQSAKEGDPAGVAGHAVAATAPYVAGEAISQGASSIKDALPSKVRAGAALQEIKSSVGDMPIKSGKVGDAALELYTQSQRGANLPSAVNKLVRRMTAPDSAPLTYAEAKDFQSNISSLSANEKMNLKPNQVRLLGQLNQALKDGLADTADVVGKGEQFTSAMKEYHNAMKLKGWTEEAISNGWKVALGALGARELAKIVGVGGR